MRNLLRRRVRPLLVVSSACLIGAAIAYANPNPPLSEQPVHGGDITGAMTSCGVAIAGATVYIPGRSFLAITDPAGGFELNYVPPGTYSLVVRNQANQDIATVPGVVVLKNRVTALGGVSVPCPDADGDGFDGLADCDDANPAVFPNAPEVCNDIDDSCDGVVDEGCQACVDIDGDGVCAPADCDDNDPAVNPNAPEVCQDGIDNNCNLQIDDGCPECEVDADCESGLFCNASNACQAQLPDGADCTANGQCLSGACVAAVCTQIGS